MSIKTQLKWLAFKFGIIVNKAVSPNELENFVSRFRSKYKSIELVRIGGNGDGGYLLPNNFTSVKYCFSPGVDYTAKFEKELSQKYGIKSFMADASVSQAPLNDENFIFVKKFLGNRSVGEFITLSDWMKDSVADDAQDMILQMDIEGGEYDVLTFETAETLAKFSSIVIEFHGLENIFERHFLQMIQSIFEKLYQNFSICHVHPNNCCGMSSLYGIDVPRVLEVSFVRNDLIDRFKSDLPISLPHPLDKKNAENKLDIDMPYSWWKE